MGPTTARTAQAPHGGVDHDAKSPTHDMVRWTTMRTANHDAAGFEDDANSP